MYNIHSLLTEGILKFGEHEYIFEREGDRFVGKSYRQFVDDVRRLVCALLRYNLSGKTIILFGENSYNYMVADIAVMGYVGISATISKEWKSDDLIKAAEHLSAEAVIYSSQKADVIEELQKSLPQLTYICFDEFSSLIESQSLREIQPNDSDVCCKIMFSSGTTGTPKAVMLSQKNMFANWDSLRKRVPLAVDDKDYLFLPLSHAYAGICNFLYSLSSGMSLYLCSDTKRIAEELQMVKPTTFCSVPLIYEKLYDICKSANMKPRDIFGENIRYLFDGGAYLRPEIREFIKSDGLNLMESYGLSESSSLVSTEYNSPDDFDSVGTPLDSVEVIIDNPDEQGRGEILVYGDNVFLGYYNNPEATAAVLSDGWLRTGDIGFLKDGKLYLVGRKRRMILLSNGENVFPDEIEALFSDYQEINKVKVYERDKTICAALYVNVKCDGEAIITEVNGKLPRFAKIRSFDVISDSIETRMK